MFFFGHDNNFLNIFDDLNYLTSDVVLEPVQL